MWAMDMMAWCRYGVTMTSPPDDQTARVTLRIPQHLLDRIDLRAAQTRRSRNSQLLSCIEWTLDNTAAEVA